MHKSPTTPQPSAIHPPALKMDTDRARNASASPLSTPLSTTLARCSNNAKKAFRDLEKKEKKKLSLKSSVIKLYDYKKVVNGSQINV